MMLSDSLSVLSLAVCECWHVSQGIVEQGLLKKPRILNRGGC